MATTSKAGSKNLFKSQHKKNEIDKYMEIFKEKANKKVRGKVRSTVPKKEVYKNAKITLRNCDTL